MDQTSNADSAPKRAIRHSWSANRHMKSSDWHFPSVDWPKLLAQPKDSLIEIRLIFYNLLEIRTCSSLYLISFFKIPTSINRGNKSKLRALFFLLFNSRYVKDVLEAFALGTFLL